VKKGRLRAAVKERDTTTAEIILVGYISFDGEKVVISEPARMLAWMAREPIMIDGATYPEDEPEKFVRNLHLAYRGSYAWADEAEEY
jgi:hypothetical protein